MTEALTPDLHARMALTIAGFEAPSPASPDQEPMAEFEWLFDAGAHLELALMFSADRQVFDVEVRMPQASPATQEAALVLARTLDDLKCSLQASTGHLCITRRTPWAAQAQPDDLADLMAQMVVLGHELMDAKRQDAPIQDNPTAAEMIRG